MNLPIRTGINLFKEGKGNRKLKSMSPDFGRGERNPELAVKLFREGFQFVIEINRGVKMPGHGSFLLLLSRVVGLPLCGDREKHPQHEQNNGKGLVTPGKP